MAAVDVAGAVVVWRAARVEGHRRPARAARLFSYSWLAVLGWGATVTAAVAWLGELGGAALNRDPGTAGLTVAALVTLAAAVAGVVGDVAASWTPAGVAETSVRRVYGGRFPGSRPTDPTRPPTATAITRCGTTRPSSPAPRSCTGGAWTPAGAASSWWRSPSDRGRPPWERELLRR